MEGSNIFHKYSAAHSHSTNSIIFFMYLLFVYINCLVNILPKLYTLRHNGLPSWEYKLPLKTHFSQKPHDCIVIEYIFVVSQNLDQE